MQTLQQAHSNTHIIDQSYEYHTLRDVVTSAEEAETKGVFFKCKTIASHTLHFNCYETSSTPPIATYKTTTTGFAHNNMVMKRSTSWDINLHWLRDKEL